MPVYEYECPYCGNRDDHFFTFDKSATTVHCPNCRVPMTKRYSVNFQRPMPDHWNRTVGAPVSSRRQFEDHLKRQSEEATLRTGIEHNYQPVDLGDRDALGVTEEGLESTRRQQVETGQLEVRRWL